MRNYRSTTSSTKNLKEKLVLVREGLLYGLSIEDRKSEKVSLNRKITSTPTFLFYENNTKCLIDYSNQTNSEIETTLHDYFSQIEKGVTFQMYNAIYKDPNSGSLADLSGIYTFKGFYNGIVEADVTSVTLFSTNTNRYDKTKFEEIPYIIPTSVSTTSTITSIIKNNLGKNTKNSFNYLGIKVGDYIKLTDMSAHVKVVSVDIDTDGSEYLLLEKHIDSVNLLHLQTKVEVYIPVIDKYEIGPDLKETTVGSCIEYAGGVVISCTDNHTTSQCRFRSSPLKGIISEFTPGIFCTTPETDTAIQRSSTDNLIQLTATVANTVANISLNQGTAGVVNKKGNITNTFYGKPF